MYAAPVLSTAAEAGDRQQKERFVAFAFAAADMLVEVTADGTIHYAAGAFQARTGSTPDSFLGAPISKLFAAADQTAAGMAVSTTALRGRLPPVVLHLADRAATPVVMSGLANPSAPGRLCFTLGRLPATPSAHQTSLAAPAFGRLAEERLRTGTEAALGLVELRGWLDARSSLGQEAQTALQGEIMQVLARSAGPGGIAGEIEPGRFGVLGSSPAELTALAGELEAVLRANPATARTRVQSMELPMDHEGLTGVQAACALRYALSRFAAGGTKATAEAGLSHGLADFIVNARHRARAMRATLAENRFRLAYQPIVTLGSRATHHFEALLRPTFTAGSPIQTTQDFISFAESVGLSEELDCAVLQQAIAAQAECSGASIAVNVSGLSMQSPAFREQMLRLLATTEQPGSILVELTETADIEDVAEAATSIADLRERGVPVCLDDFGAGAAAFRYLRDFPVDFVKLDGAYVRGAVQNAREHGFLTSMIELAHFVGAEVIAEAIEGEAEATLMQDLGVEYGQGWLFGKPGTLPGSLRAVG